MAVFGLLPISEKVVSTRLGGSIAMRWSSHYLGAASALLHVLDSVDFLIL